MPEGNCQCIGNIKAAACTACAAGTWYNYVSKKCEKCNKLCTTCDLSADICVLCPGGQIADAVTGICACPSTMSWNVNICVAPLITCPTGLIFNAGKCVCSVATQYWNGVTCVTPSVTCPTSTVANAAGQCVCADPNSIWSGTTCVAVDVPTTTLSCAAGAYLPTATSTVCAPCPGTLCATCENVTGRCLTCTGINQQDPNNQNNCIACTQPVGPVSSPMACGTNQATSTRVVPAF